MLHEKHSSKRTAPKVSKGRPESPLGSEAFVASGDNEKAERVSRNERPLAATIEAADAARRRETSPFGKAIVLSANSMSVVQKISGRSRFNGFIRTQAYMPFFAMYA